eukprot:3169103-Alexandrium_andersonii.AAC.1
MLGASGRPAVEQRARFIAAPAGPPQTRLQLIVLRAPFGASGRSAVEPRARFGAAPAGPPPGPAAAHCVAA